MPEKILIPVGTFVVPKQTMTEVANGSRAIELPDPYYEVTRAWYGTSGKQKISIAKTIGLKEDISSEFLADDFDIYPAV